MHAVFKVKKVLLILVIVAWMEFDIAEFKVLVIIFSYIAKHVLRHYWIIQCTYNFYFIYCNNREGVNVNTSATTSKVEVLALNGRSQIWNTFFCLILTRLLQSAVHTVTEG